MSAARVLWLRRGRRWMSSLYRSRRWGFEEISGGRKPSHGPLLNPSDTELTGTRAATRTLC